ncbi:peptidyl-prolyl cis-trans isomerase [Solirubrobacter sp. CPCC 204708]|uniref:Peptidylprolyl isomerase n=1 Tax=Solirubrobacter deserti TaxID=2282478 RepID=A0ABT4RP86_9ACTN|nr:peptidylprolyl isomerase [Solirubrobacter deserti]MBE2317495.1 peptidyl-prolyl cis-trans isomerase [Solirubrobacter deserti]MDA0140327.1 peptidylprolyl isomerase [Solirubrobacter deserti]
MLKFVALAVAVTVAGPGYSETIEEREIAGNRLATLIERHWVEGEARERGIVETETDPDLRHELLQAAINAQIAEPAAKSVTPEQVKAYVDANPQSSPERRTVRYLATNNRRAARAALTKLRRGASFSSLGGEVREFDRTDTHAVGRAIFRARPNRLTRYGRAVFKVIRHAPARPLPRAQQEATAWERLATEAQERALADFRVQFTAKWRERTTCAPGYVSVEHCGTPPSGQGAP